MQTSIESVTQLRVEVLKILSRSSGQGFACVGISTTINAIARTTDDTEELGRANDTAIIAGRDTVQ